MLNRVETLLGKRGIFLINIVIVPGAGRARPEGTNSAWHELNVVILLRSNPRCGHLPARALLWIGAAEMSTRVDIPNPSYSHPLGVAGRQELCFSVCFALSCAGGVITQSARDYGSQAPRGVNDTAPELSSLPALLQACSLSWGAPSAGDDQSVVRAWPTLSPKSQQLCGDGETKQLRREPGLQRMNHQG